LASAVHDCSDGGLAVALAEMAMAGDMGATINAPEKGDPAGVFFGEDQGRYIVTIKANDLDAVLTNAQKARILAPQIGTTGGSALKLANARAISVGELIKAHQGWFCAYMDI